ncbi:hypothetical protein Tco_0505510 [Tanacetum coccineum]
MSYGVKSKHKTIGESAQTEEPMHTTKDLEEPAHQEFEIGVTEDQPNEETPQFPYWFQRPTKLPSLDHPRESFNELMDTLLDFSAFVMNPLKVDTLTPELLTCLTFELMKGPCKSLVELEYLFEEVYKATTEQLDWNNPEGQQYSHDLRKPLPLIPNSRGLRVIPFDHFINNDLEYLKGGVSSRKYATSVTKTKAEDYGHIKWIEDLVPNKIWSQVPVSYNKHALWGISHWGQKRQQFYGFAANRESARDVYSKCRIIAVIKLKIVDWHNYKHLDWITVHRDDDNLYKFKEGDFNRLRIQDIEDMLLLLVQGKLTNLTVEERLAFNVSLRMFTRSIAIQMRVEDLQLGVRSYQKKLNLTKPDMYRPDLKRFSDGTLNDVRTALNDRLKGVQMEYLPQTIWRQSNKDKLGVMIQAIDKQLKTKRIMRSLEKFVEHSSGYRFTVKMEILLEPTSNKLMVGRIFRDVKVAPTKSRANDKAILYPALLLIVLCRLLKDGRESDEVLKLKYFKKDATLKLFKSTNQERYEHVGPEVTSSQDGKVYKMAKFTRW